MYDKRFCLVKCVKGQWGIIDNELESIDQLILMADNKNSVNGLVLLLNQLWEDKEKFRKERNILMSENYSLENKILALNKKIMDMNGEG